VEKIASSRRIMLRKNSHRCSLKKYPSDRSMKIFSTLAVFQEATNFIEKRHTLLLMRLLVCVCELM
jgi:hypothetical protein